MITWQNKRFFPPLGGNSQARRRPFFCFLERIFNPSKVNVVIVYADFLSALWKDSFIQLKRNDFVILTQQSYIFETYSQLKTVVGACTQRVENVF